MIERKTNVVMGMLHSFALEATRMKAIEMIANAQCVQEEERIDIEAIKKQQMNFYRSWKKSHSPQEISSCCFIKGAQAALFD